MPSQFYVNLYMLPHLSKYLLAVFLLCPALLLTQQNPYEDNISDIISSKNENQLVMVTAIVSKWIDDKTFEVEDKTGSISILLNNSKKPDLITGDEITLSGKVKLNEKGEKEILMTSFRKLKFIKNPANCCRPELE